MDGQADSRTDRQMDTDRRTDQGTFLSNARKSKKSSPVSLQRNQCSTLYTIRLQRKHDQQADRLGSGFFLLLPVDGWMTCDFTPISTVFHSY